MTDRCSAGSGGVDIIVDFKRTVAKKTSDNLIEMTFTMMISPNLPQPRVYDLCGQTHDLIFDLSITDTNEIIQVWSPTQFYSVDFSQSRIGGNRCVFYKRTIKVCVSCC